MVRSATLCDRVNPFSAGRVNHGDLPFSDPAPDSAGVDANVRGVFFDAEELVTHGDVFLPGLQALHRVRGKAVQVYRLLYIGGCTVAPMVHLHRFCTELHLSQSAP